MLDPRTWLSKAQSLPEGRKARVSHDCGPGECMMVSHKAEGWSAHCFRCSEANGEGWVPRPAESLAERLERIKRSRIAEIRIAQSVDLPQGEPDPQQWPLAARVWLYKAGLSNSDIEKLGIRWSKAMERVVVPLYKNGKVVYWQARSLSKEDGVAKYVNPSVPRDHLMFRAGSGPLVLTEDILSAYRMSKAGYSGWALMGTKLNDFNATQIIRHSKDGDVRVSLWLDPDQAGQGAARKIAKSLRAYGVAVSNIVSARDPKLYSRIEIIKTLGGNDHDECSTCNTNRSAVTTGCEQDRSEYEAAESSSSWLHEAGHGGSGRVQSLGLAKGGA